MQLWFAFSFLHLHATMEGNCHLGRVGVTPYDAGMLILRSTNEISMTSVRQSPAVSRVPPDLSPEYKLPVHPAPGFFYSTLAELPVRLFPDY